MLGLCSQLYFGGSPFFFFFCVPSHIFGVHNSSSAAFPAISLRFTIYDEIFAHVSVFNPTTEVVTLRLSGWRILGAFLLPAFTRLGNECRDLLSPCDRMHVCAD